MYVNTSTSKKSELFPASLIEGYHTRNNIRNTKAFKDRNQSWSKAKMGWWQATGHIMVTMREHKPKTYEEWLHVYFTYCKKWEEVTWAGGLYAKIAGITETQGIADFIIHNIDQSWEGYEAELKAEELLNDWAEFHGYTIREATPFEDLNYAVDFIANNGSEIIMGIQVKPESFFKSTRIQKDRDKYKTSNRIFTERFKAPVNYVSTDAVKNNILKFIPIEEVL